MEDQTIGQVWVCSATETCPPLLCVIGEIDDLPAKSDGSGLLRVLSISVTPHPDARAAGWKPVGHLPISESGFRNSGLRHVKDGATVGRQFRQGYEIWRAEFERGRARIVETSLSEFYLDLVATLKQFDLPGGNPEKQQFICSHRGEFPDFSPP